MAAADTLMLSEQLARRLKVRIGDQLTLPTPQGPWALRIVGIYADYGNPKGHVLVNVEHLLAHWPNLTPNRFNLRIEPPAIPALVTALQDRFGLMTAASSTRPGSRAGRPRCSNVPSPPPPPSTA